ncbi:MAG TPA: hypothetical protein DGD08_05185 [Gemmatimonas aurantiaca]|uniref:Uncharacterized protein n=1 Tax=Gemmatimonas aurantiaca TaxID=173480 RepID=A0A3D4V771_9BACT|nr:hypothetical protein [Gemmatimonas aurantiaca]HCT56592.1 hypothetical protein [Gemmatimonas aurantiaca]
MLPLLFAGVTSCDRVKTALNPPQVDTYWQSDSTFLASKPTVLFRVDRSGNLPRLIPIATVGAKGLRSLGMTSRGWRAFDIDYLHSNATFTPYRYGEPLSAVRSTRGMWEGEPLDTLPCPSPLPAALASIDSRVELLTSGGTPLARPHMTSLSDGELQGVLSTVNTLVAPTAGISLSRMSRYQRNVYAVATGASTRPTVIVTYDDPEALPDSATRITERPRHLMVVLDKGVYGYKPSYTYSDVSSSRIQPRRKFLGALDADGDGKAELYFGVQLPQFPLVTYAYGYEGDTWLEVFKYERGRCQ